MMRDSQRVNGCTNTQALPGSDGLLVRVNVDSIKAVAVVAIITVVDRWTPRLGIDGSLRTRLAGRRSSTSASPTSSPKATNCWNSSRGFRGRSGNRTCCSRQPGSSVDQPTPMTGSWSSFDQAPTTSKPPCGPGRPRRTRWRDVLHSCLSWRALMLTLR